MTLPDVERIVALDGDEFLGVHVIGHVEDDVAVALATAWMLDQEDGEDWAWSLDRPRRTWVRKVPHVDYCDFWGFRFVYASTPGPGARAVTLVEVSAGRRGTCSLCPWEAVAYVGPNRTALCRNHAADWWNSRPERLGGVA